MYLAGQGAPGQPTPPVQKLDDGGYIMVVLLIGIAVSAVWMGAMLPAWRQQAVRQKEAELIFRGEEYARAIALYWRKNNQTLPPSFDVLVSQRYLRKKYLDPITNREFLAVGGIGPGSTSPSAGGRALGPGAGARRTKPVRSARRDLRRAEHEHRDVHRRVSGSDFVLAVSVRLHRRAPAHGSGLAPARWRSRRWAGRPPRGHGPAGSDRRSRPGPRNRPSRSARPRPWDQPRQGPADGTGPRPLDRRFGVRGSWVRKWVLRFPGRYKVLRARTSSTFEPRTHLRTYDATSEPPHLPNGSNLPSQRPASNAVTIASWTRGRSERCASFVRVGWTRFVSSTTYRSRA